MNEILDWIGKQYRVFLTEKALGKTLLALLPLFYLYHSLGKTIALTVPPNVLLVFYLKK